MGNKAKSLLILFSFIYSLSLFSMVKLENNKPINIKSRQEKAVSMVNQAVGFIKSNSIEKACRSFESENKWLYGELSVLLLDENGIVLVNGTNPNLIWENLSKSPIYYKKQAWKALSNVKALGQWVSYIWQGDRKTSYAKRVQKGNHSYIVSVGFYPDTSRFIVKQLVNSAASLFANQGPAKAWRTINNPFGPFEKGEIRVFAYNLNGIKLADSQDLSLVEQNLINFKDTKGNYFVQKIINTAKSKNAGWVDYDYRFANTLAYVKLVTDKASGQSFVIGAAYYPDISSKTVEELVDAAKSELIVAGSLKAFNEFTSTSINSKYNYGPLELFVYDLKGNVLVDAENSRLVGQNIINLQDSSGYYVTKAIIELANTQGRGWVSFYKKNSMKLVFIELVDTSEGKYIVGSGYYPVSKSQQVITLVDRASEYLAKNNKYIAFSEFSNPNGRYFKGDLNIFVYSASGASLVNGDNKMVVWDNFIKEGYKDEVIVDEVINLAKAGGGWLDYKVRNSKRRVYAKMITKEHKLPNGSIKTEQLIVGSGYFI